MPLLPVYENIKNMDRNATCACWIWMKGCGPRPGNDTSEKWEYEIQSSGDNSSCSLDDTNNNMQVDRSVHSHTSVRALRYSNILLIVTTCKGWRKKLRNWTYVLFTTLRNRLASPSDAGAHVAWQHKHFRHGTYDVPALVRWLGWRPRT
jgi:hypothetical protein